MNLGFGEPTPWKHFSYTFYDNNDVVMWERTYPSITTYAANIRLVEYAATRDSRRDEPYRVFELHGKEHNACELHRWTCPSITRIKPRPFKDELIMAVCARSKE